MLNAELPITTILEMLSKKRFPFSKKTLLTSEEYPNIPIGIFTPQHKETPSLWSGKFRSLLFGESFHEIAILDTVPWNAKNVFVKHLAFSRPDTCEVVESFMFSNLQFQTFYLGLKKQNRYITLLLPKRFSYVLSQTSTLFRFVEHTKFPFRATAKIQSVAIIYDSSLSQSYKEAETLHDTLKKYFPLLKVSLFSLPLEQSHLDHVLNSHDLIHYAGHITPDGIFSGQMPTSHPSTPPRFLFLNGCKIPRDALEYLSTWDAPIVYSSEVQVDTLVSLEKIQSFYLGLFLGFRLGILANNLPPHIKVMGYSHFQIEENPYEF